MEDDILKELVMMERSWLIVRYDGRYDALRCTKARRGEDFVTREGIRTRNRHLPLPGLPGLPRQPVNGEYETLTLKLVEINRQTRCNGEYEASCSQLAEIKQHQW